MPIYEFKCSKCESFFEVIVRGSDDQDSVKCPDCSSAEFERVISKTNFSMGSSGGSGGRQTGVQTQERQCSSGSCKTYTVPGEVR